MIASSIALAAGRGRQVKDGYVVSGRWPFSSAVDNCEWNMLAVTIYDEDGKTAIDWRLCLVPKSDYKIIDTWYAMGMVGTGSKDIEVKEIHVPEHRALRLTRCRGGAEHPGARLNGGPLYRIPMVAAAGHPLSAAALGAAEGALEHVVKVFAKRVGTYTGAKVSEFQAVQIKIARARALVDSARYLMRESAIAFDRDAERREVPDLERKLRLRVQNTMAVMQSREAVETLWSCYGANGIYTRDPLQRYLRDTQAINQHFSFNFDIAGSAYGTVALGGKYANPTM
jgi:3-hydroxy-9,10-secoandrosta-1,3,5(10)-triene-9,17-dione monooxygenase